MTYPNLRQETYFISSHAHVQRRHWLRSQRAKLSRRYCVCMGLDVCLLSLQLVFEDVAVLPNGFAKCDGTLLLQAVEM